MFHRSVVSVIRFSLLLGALLFLSEQRHRSPLNARAVGQSVASCTTPSFSVATQFAVEGGTQSIAVGDFNGDGKADCATTGANIAVMLGNGTGGFGAATYLSAGAYSKSVVVGDFNGMGNPIWR